MSDAPDLTDALTAMFGSEERDRRRDEIPTVIAEAAADHARYRDRAAGQRDRGELSRLIRLCDAALDGGAKDTAALLNVVRDGIAVDALLDRVMGYGDDGAPTNGAGRIVAAAAGTVGILPSIAGLRRSADIALGAAEPRSRNRRSLRFVQVLHLAAWCAAATGNVPVAYVDERGRARGAFGDLVEAINAAIGLDRPHTPWGEIVREVLTVCAVPIESAAAFRVPLPAFGSPDFILSER